MKKILKKATAVLAMLVALTANADDKGRLYIIGSATSYGWELDNAQSLVASTDNPSVYSATLYLKGGESNTFKFMEAYEWGGIEYGLSTDAASSTVAGEVKLASGTLDNGYKQMTVATDGNYLMIINTETLEASITRSDYQETEIKYCALYMVGNATTGGWTVSDGTPLRQLQATPYEYESEVALKATENGNPASFKIATALRGASGWDARYFMFRDSADAGKISTDSTDDRQWSVTEDGDYTVSVNTLTNTISIEKVNGNASGIDNITTPSDATVTPVYYDLQGRPVLHPAKGIYLEVKGSDVRKVIF